MRKLDEVIDAMLNVIPAHEEDLIAALKSNQESFYFSPPEQYGLRWQITAETLDDRFGNEEYAQGTWEDAVIHIWMGN